MPTSSKQKSTALILCIFGGEFGLHQFYVGNKNKGFLYLFTMGLFGIGWVIDIIKILSGTFRDYSGLLLSDGNIPQYNYQNQYRYTPYQSPTSPPQALDVKDYDDMDGHQFEYFCSDVLKRNGFINVEVTQGSGDHGIDVLAEKDSITYAIQCKCYSSNIGNAAVQQAHTGKSLYKKDIAVVLTNRYFTSQAKQEADALGVKLWDRNKLEELKSNANL